ncbi:Ferredoxin C 1, chloroplastic [Sesamum alatum]|uniref:Ferredoxin C 1, chloroplastic n=1 Tax=Sesamum alatum TaxID=300844 RepID=A0AAE2CTL7_9LAMI|nr:Ferredoxin C 1, chloroplastic [Sesamum alatum]
MAALYSSPSLLLNFRNHTFQPNSPPRLKLHSTSTASRIRRLSTSVRAYKVVIEQDGKTTELEVEPDETILEKALDSDLPVPHDCKLGVCMTCPARLVAGNVDQSEGMLSDDVVERGYALLCVSYPRSDCHVKVIPEEELLSLQLATAND